MLLNSFTQVKEEYFTTITYSCVRALVAVKSPSGKVEIRFLVRFLQNKQLLWLFMNLKVVTNVVLTQIKEREPFLPLISPHSNEH